VNLLLDTQILLWAAGHPEQLSAPARKLLSSTKHDLFFSPASLWEIAIKSGLGRLDFRVNARQLRRGLLDNGYVEIPITSEHVVSVDQLPPLHQDAFDRILIAQALVEGMTLVTADAELAKYPGPIRKV
jgi:PIN domain nuclease of toxin-antitoxin system